MSTPDRSDETVPAWPAALPPARRPPSAWEEPAEAEAPAARSFSARVVWRALRRHWWQILLLWVVGSSGLMFLAYKKIKPVYEATARLEIRPEIDGIFGRGGNASDFNRYQKTQQQQVTNTDVLGNALALHPELAGWPLIRDDPEAAIGQNLRVNILPDTHLMQVSLSSEIRAEAVAIVDGVVEAYLVAANNWANREANEQLKRLNGERERLDAEVNAMKKRVKALYASTKGFHRPDAARGQEEGTLARYNRLLEHRTELDLNKYRLQGQLVGLQTQSKGSGDARGISEDDVVRAFLASPGAAELDQRRQQLKASYERSVRIARRKNDPTVVQSKKALDEAEGQFHALWNKRRAALRRQLEKDGHDDGGVPKLMDEMLVQIAALDAERQSITKELLTISGDHKDVEGGALEVDFAQSELANIERIRRAVNDSILRLEFDAKGPTKIGRSGQTAVAPSANRRLKFMAAAPAGVLALLVAFFVLLEARSGRVSDPDDVPSRARVEVLGVVPPLPSLQPTRALWGGRGEYRARRRLEEFVQSLDHLRVALCAAPGGGDGHRCVLITSACGSEGKTTLAAHLAGRCANAGMSTLLIDADLRNPSLSRLLKVPEGPGLSDVLRGVATPESALMVIEAGGGFHLLPAGTPGYDPSRLLQADRLARLLGQFRQAFDIVIVDAPPVLLVPDALIIGRCTDGAVLAVRYDTSRFRLLEQANRRLAAVGVPVLGAVVNGVRTMESSYSDYAYSYAYQSGRSGGDPGAIDVPAEPLG